LFQWSPLKRSQAEGRDPLKQLLRSVIAGLVAFVEDEGWTRFQQEEESSDASQQGQVAQPADAPQPAKTKTSFKPHGRPTASFSDLHSEKSSKAPSDGRSSNAQSGRSSRAPSIRNQILPPEEKKRYEAMEAAAGRLTRNRKLQQGRLTRKRISGRSLRYLASPLVTRTKDERLSSCRFLTVYALTVVARCAAESAVCRARRTFILLC